MSRKGFIEVFSIIEAIRDMYNDLKTYLKRKIRFESADNTTRGIFIVGYPILWIAGLVALFLWLRSRNWINWKVIALVIIGIQVLIWFFDFFSWVGRRKE